MVKSNVSIFPSTIFRESRNTQDVNTGDMIFQGYVDRRQSDSCIPVISVSIDLPVHTRLTFYEKKIKIQASEYFTYRIYNDVPAIFMSTTVNWILFVMYQFSPFLLVSAMTNLRTDEYKYHWPGCIACERKYLSLYSQD